VLYPTLRPTVQWWGPVITRFETPRREVWLTIDDGPTDDTRALLDLFDRKNVTATFFVKGVLAAAHRDLIDEIVARGHSVANHSNTHPAGSFWCALPGRIGEEIDLCNRALGGTTKWFRAPVGLKNFFVHPALEQRGMRLIGWTARAFDAVVSDVAQIEARIVANLRPGTIIVLHQGLAHSVAALERVVDAVQARGYAFVIPSDDALR
jgi:peptidoglycan/xylan/chitin deacetylase (PgdA/CDA1 family)